MRYLELKHLVVNCFHLSFLLCAFYFIQSRYSSIFTDFFPPFFSISSVLLPFSHCQVLIYLKESTCSSFGQASSFRKSSLFDYWRLFKHAFFDATLYATFWFCMQAVKNLFQRSQEWYQDYKKSRLIAGLLLPHLPIVKA